MFGGEYADLGLASSASADKPPSGKKKIKLKPAKMTHAHERVVAAIAEHKNSKSSNGKIAEPAPAGKSKKAQKVRAGKKAAVPAGDVMTVSGATKRTKQSVGALPGDSMAGGEPPCPTTSAAARTAAASSAPPAPQHPILIATACARLRAILFFSAIPPPCAPGSTARTHADERYRPSFLYIYVFTSLGSRQHCASLQPRSRKCARMIRSKPLRSAKGCGWSISRHGTTRTALRSRPSLCLTWPCRRSFSSRLPSCCLTRRRSPKNVCRQIPILRVPAPPPSLC